MEPRLVRDPRPRRGAMMEMEPGCANTAFGRSGGKSPSVSKGQDGVLEACYDLVCLGRPLSEILDEVKRIIDEINQRIVEIPAEVVDAQANLATPVKIEWVFQKTPTI